MSRKRRREEALSPHQSTLEDYFVARSKRKAVEAERPRRYDGKKQAGGVLRLHLARRATGVGVGASGIRAAALCRADAGGGALASSEVRGTLCDGAEDEAAALDVASATRALKLRTMDWDKEGRMILAVEGDRGLTVVDSLGNDVVFDTTRFPHSVGCARWSVGNEDLCHVAFPMHNQVWCVDLGVCDADKPEPVSTLTLPSQTGVNEVRQHERSPHVVYVASRDSRVHVFDTRQKVGLVGTFMFSGDYEARRLKGGVAAFGSRPTASTSAQPSFSISGAMPNNSVGMRQAAGAVHHATTLMLGGHNVYCGYGNGRVAQFDERAYSSGAVHSSDVAGAKLLNAAGEEMTGIKRAHKDEGFNRIDDMHPSPYTMHGVVCLLASGCVVELDLVAQACSRVYYPFYEHDYRVAAEADDGEAPPAREVSHQMSVDARVRRQMAYIEDLRSFAFPSEYGVAVLPWEGTHFGKWEARVGGGGSGVEERRSLFSTNKQPGAKRLYTVPGPRAFCVSQNPWNRSILSCSSIGMLSTPVLAKAT